MSDKGFFLERPRFTCPRCGRGSSHPMDIEHGYCGNCHDWTGVVADPTFAEHTAQLSGPPDLTVTCTTCQVVFDDMTGWLEHLDKHMPD